MSEKIAEIIQIGFIVRLWSILVIMHPLYL
jgi:hypothetical protein